MNSQSDLHQVVFGFRWLRIVVAVMILFFVFHPVMPALGFEGEASMNDQSEASSAINNASESDSDSEGAEESNMTENVDETNPDEPVPDEQQTEPEVETTEPTTEVASESESTEAEEIAPSLNNGEPESATSVQSDQGVVDNTDAASDTDVAAPATVATTTSPTSISDTAVSLDEENGSSAGESATSTSNGGGGNTSVQTDVTSDEHSVTATSSGSVSDVGGVDATLSTSTNTSATSSEPVAEIGQSIEPTDQQSEESANADDVIQTDTSATSETLAGNESESDSSDSNDDITSESLADVAGASTSTATTVPEVRYLEMTGEVQHTNNSYNFERAACTAMGDGGFYCFDEKAPLAADLTADIFVDVDSDGDRELFYRDEAGKVTQLTFNVVDDMAPAYDPVSDTVVWQRLEKGTYQIYTTANGEEVRLSATGVNNMEPHRSGDVVVWQSWQTDNWDVVMYLDGKEIVISDSEAQDIAPHVQGEHVIWSTTSGDETVVTVYDISSGLRSVIADSEGGRVENPRFVLIYDTKYENGDVVTMGFDAETGEVIPLAAQPATPPPDIPDSDQTGETRALIQNKSSSRDDADEELVPVDLDTDDLVPSEDLVSATTSTDENLDDVVDMSTATATEVTLPLTDYDLIVEPFPISSEGAITTATSTQQDDSAL